MFPNQTPPTSTTAAAGTSQTATTTAQSATSATLTPAIVGAANTANMPETTAAQVLPPQAVQQGAQRAQRTTRRASQGRAQPYQRRAPATQTTANLPQEQVTAAAQGYQSTNWCLGEADLINAASALQVILPYLSQTTGIVWTDPAAAAATADAEQGDTGEQGAGASAISSLGLSFPQAATKTGLSPELRELLLRVNNELNRERRTYLLIRAMRAFSEMNVVESSTVATLGELLDLNSRYVPPWFSTLPAISTVVARGGADSEPLSIRLPIDLLKWPELVRFLRAHIPLQGSAETGAGAASIPSTMGLTFDPSFISQQHPELGKEIAKFHSAQTSPRRNIFFAHIICALKDSPPQSLPLGTFFHVCRLLGVDRPSVSNWYTKYKNRTSASQSVVTTPAPTLVPRTLVLHAATRASSSRSIPSASVTSAPAAPNLALRPIAAPVFTRTPTLLAMLTPTATQVAPTFLQQSATASTTPSLTLAAVARPAALTFPSPTAATSAAPSVVQAPASPAFTAPTSSSASAAGQLVPALPPFTVSVPPQSLGMTALDDDDEVQAAPISPVFPGPFSPPAIDTSTYSTAQLDPTLLPFTQATPAPSLEELLALPIVRDPSVEMDVAEILEGSDFDLDL
ncbi:MAG: hypothetical protein ACRC7P_00945 [Enterovibrio sp.]